MRAIVIALILVLVLAVGAWAEVSYDRVNMSGKNGTAFVANGNGLIYGALTAQKLGTATITTDATLTAAAHGGKVCLVTGAATITLPANTTAAGTWIMIVVTADVTVTVAAATADTLIANDGTNNADVAADSVAFSTASKKAGSAVLLVATGTQWCAINVGASIMTIAS